MNRPSSMHYRQWPARDSIGEEEGTNECSNNHNRTEGKGPSVGGVPYPCSPFLVFHSTPLCQVAEYIWKKSNQICMNTLLSYQRFPKPVKIVASFAVAKIFAGSYRWGNLSREASVNSLSTLRMSQSFFCFEIFYIKKVHNLSSYFNFEACSWHRGQNVRKWNVRSIQ